MLLGVIMSIIYVILFFIRKKNEILSDINI